MTIVDIPYEIHTLISSYILGDTYSTAALLSCSLVCQAMRIVYQPLLYRFIWFGTTIPPDSPERKKLSYVGPYNKRISLFYRTVSRPESKHLADEVASLTLEDEAFCAFGASHLSLLPRVLPHVRHLRMSWYKHWLRPTWDLQVDHEFIAAALTFWGATLESLEVENFAGFPLADIIPSLRRLRYISLLGVVPQDEQMSHSSSPTTPRSFWKSLTKKLIRTRNYTPNNSTLESPSSTPTNVIRSIWFTPPRILGYGWYPCTNSNLYEFPPSCDLTDILLSDFPPTLEEIRLEPFGPIPYHVGLPHLQRLAFSVQMESEAISFIIHSLPLSRTEAPQLQLVSFEPLTDIYSPDLVGPAVWEALEARIMDLEVYIHISLMPERGYGTTVYENPFKIWREVLKVCDSAGKLCFWVWSAEDGVHVPLSGTELDWKDLGEFHRGRFINWDSVNSLRESSQMSSLGSVLSEFHQGRFVSWDGTDSLQGSSQMSSLGTIRTRTSLLGGVWYG
ncbi:hypothetical protein DL96DRAFT_1624680 [Flagelloscypha sp. PMI_526]|nr:hypothetical protein DL96DRAFT_1624680 [Flagelloscypha sp. PMI_526]